MPAACCTRCRSALVDLPSVLVARSGPALERLPSMALCGDCLTAVMRTIADGTRDATLADLRAIETRPAASMA